MFRSIRILLAIAAWYDYEIWQMDVKTAFLNGNIKEEIYMTQPEGFTSVGSEHKVCKLHRSIYVLKQASRSWNLRFDETIKEFDFIKNPDEPYVYKKVVKNAVTFLVLYVDDILLIGNDVGMLQSTKVWLSSRFSMKDMGEASYILVASSGYELFSITKELGRFLSAWQASVKIPRSDLHARLLISFALDDVGGVATRGGASAELGLSVERSGVMCLRRRATRMTSAELGFVVQVGLPPEEVPVRNWA
ncbi:hypothetical protein F511_12705 [Dorcoceras hygrometricum]|uniref:Reverse transcriptase Ty1/copia-type domain-containing protein n=1 Tax=Dorcoceras hygrometricum TaxID=472368 RepID=A0A2Z7DA83_9LAMI|nr:hypothetical protein F511_12705 [Dorcoceras hygrometricum]